jgi:hypothetical protein
MNKTMLSALSLAAFLGVAAFLNTTGAQTPQGDIIRAQGAFLDGAGWYNLHTAEADRINVETWKAVNREAERVYNNFLMERYRHNEHSKKLTKKVQDDFKKRYEQAQRRWRTNPTPDDIRSGDALNAMAADLANPSITPSTWRTAQIDLPPNMSLTSLAFKIADTKQSSALRSTVAIDRMLVSSDWPLWFRRPEITSECDAYSKAVAFVVDKCRRKNQLQAIDVDRLRDAVSALSKKVDDAIPTSDGQRSRAKEFVRRLEEATRIFGEQTYAELLVRDVSEHRATSIAELLAFMRYYRLMFDDPGSSPEVLDVYDRLYGLLRQQKDTLGIAPPAPLVTRPSAVFKVGTVWVGATPKGIPVKLKVEERGPRRFRATFTHGNNIIREVRGEVRDDGFSWRGRDVKVVKGATKNLGGDYDATFQGDELRFRVDMADGSIVRYALHLAH